MDSLQLGNEQGEIHVSRDGTLAFRLTGEKLLTEGLALREGRLELVGLAPIAGVFHYATQSCYESVIIRLEGKPSPVLDQAAGEWPPAIDDEYLEMYQNLHFLEERKTGIPWRLERWYTLAGPYLIFESHQYSERSRPRQQGKDWERVIVELRQVLHLPDRPGPASGSGLIHCAET